MAGQVWDVASNTLYHADRKRVGSTQLKTILHSPQDFYEQFVGTKEDGTPLRVKEPTPDMILGSAVHCLVLEPGNFDKLFSIRPEDTKGNSKAAIAKKAEWRLAMLTAGKQELTEEQHDTARAMAAAVLAEPTLQKLLAECSSVIRERAIIWEEDGIWQKCKPDWFLSCPESDSDLHLDLKTSDDPTPEKWREMKTSNPMFSLKYALQVSAHYPVGIEALTGRPCASGVVVVGKSEPHQVYIHPTGVFRECGEEWRQRAFDLLRHCRETGRWRDPRQDRIEPPNDPVPAWAFPKAMEF